MWPLYAAQAAQVGFSLIGGSKAKKAAKKAGKRQAAAIMAQYQEQRRRRVLEQKQEAGLAALTSYASNLQQSGSTAAYQDFMQAEYARELDWMKKSAESAAYAAKKGGSSAGKAAFMSGLGDALQIGVGAISSSDYFTGAGAGRGVGTVLTPNQSTPTSKAYGSYGSSNRGFGLTFNRY